MTTTLSDTNSSPLSTITFDYDPDNITFSCKRTEAGQLNKTLATYTQKKHKDLKASEFIFMFTTAITDQSELNLLMEYMLKENVTGYRLTLPQKPVTSAAPFNQTYVTGKLNGFTYNDIGGTEKPYYLVTISFEVVVFL